MLEEQLVSQQGYSKGYLVQTLILEEQFLKSFNGICQGIIQGVKELLLLQIALETASGHTYQCPYSIRSPPHPFITIFTNRPEESWPLLQQEVYVICCHASKRSEEHIVSMLAPFLKFVLLHPQPSQQLFPLRQVLQKVLLLVCRKGSHRIREQLISFLANNIAVLQIDTLETFSNASDFVMALTDIGLEDSAVCGHECLDKLIRGLMGLVSFSVSRSGWPGLRITDIIHQTARHCPQVIANDDLLVSVTSVLLNAPMDLLFNLLSVVKIALLTPEALCPVVIGMTIMPVVQVLALPSPIIMEKDLRRCQHVAADIINLIQTGLCISKNTQDSSAKLEPPSCHYLVTSDLFLHSYISNQAKVFSTSSRTTVNWLISLKKSLADMDSIPRPLTNLLVALLVTSEKADVTTLTLEIIADIAKKDQSQAPSFLSVLLYELGRHDSPERRLSILNTIPSVATHKVCVAPILQTIQMLGKDPRLRAVSLCLLTSLWKIQERCFPSSTAL
ncbi:focadhesin-like [Liolophura sinensis]|uniref:focadhesin-like n=1 Tax=Liolophura sinensis TaxID=3198878 RepID=UPI003158039A